jgi:signal transduction histidine kinase
MSQVRSLVNHLRPAALNFGLVSALERLATGLSRRAIRLNCLYSAAIAPMRGFFSSGVACQGN